MRVYSVHRGETRKYCIKVKTVRLKGARGVTIHKKNGKSRGTWGIGKMGERGVIIFR